MLCPELRKGGCKKPDCKYFHPPPDEVEEETKGPVANEIKTKMCKNFEETGKCKFGAKCSFAHFTKEMLCPDFKKGRCKQSDCKFLHPSSSEDSNPPKREKRNIKFLEIEPEDSSDDIIVKTGVNHLIDQANKAGWKDNVVESFDQEIKRA